VREEKEIVFAWDRSETFSDRCLVGRDFEGLWIAFIIEWWDAWVTIIGDITGEISSAGFNPISLCSEFCQTPL
jgi:hypothetical protein